MGWTMCTSVSLEEMEGALLHWRWGAAAGDGAEKVGRGHGSPTVPMTKQEGGSGSGLLGEPRPTAKVLSQAAEPRGRAARRCQDTELEYGWQEKKAEVEQNGRNKSGAATVATRALRAC